MKVGKVRQFRKLIQKVRKFRQIERTDGSES